MVRLPNPNLWCQCTAPVLLPEPLSGWEYSFSGLFNFLETIKMSFNPNLPRAGLSASKVPRYLGEMATESFLCCSMRGAYSQVLPQWSLASSDLWTCSNFQLLFTSFIGKVCSAAALAFLCMVALCRPSLRGDSQMVLARWNESLGVAGKKIEKMLRGRMQYVSLQSQHEA